MEDPFVEIAEGDSNRTAEGATGNGAHASSHAVSPSSPAALSGSPMQSSMPAAVPSSQRPLPRHVCPFCGATSGTGHEPCPRCTMEDTPATRQATKARIGPWFVLQSRNPAAPGMKFTTLIALVNKGQITPRSVVRGPTTHQLWRLAVHVRGLSREFCMCYSCGEAIDRDSAFCIHCERPQEPPEYPDQLLEHRELSRRNPQSSQQTIMHPPVPPTPEVILPARERGFSDRLRPVSDAMTPRAKAETMRGNGRNVSAMELAVAMQNNDPGKPPRRLARAMLVLMILAFIGAGAYLWQRPDHRLLARDWIIANWNTGVQTFNDWRASAPVASPSTTLPTASKAADVPTPIATSPSQGATPTGSPEPQAARPPATPPPVEPVVLSADEALRQARELWGKALDAQGAGNFKEAVRCYETIEKLPRDVWPGGLQLNLKLARENAK